MLSVKQLFQIGRLELGKSRSISVKVIVDSVAPNKVRLTTFELEYPRFIHAEFMTHRLFSRNAASSRAIPVDQQIKLLQKSPAIPSHWGVNQKGMQADKEQDKMVHGMTREQAWYSARDDAIKHAKWFTEAGYHKQIVNRLLEPFSPIKVICSATEYDNFFWLRCHKDAQPEIKELAEMMYSARKLSFPKKLCNGEWHLPYVNEDVIRDVIEYCSKKGANMDELMVKISASCCAQVSYRSTDTSIEKSLNIYKRLVESVPVHSSPFEHQATPIDVSKIVMDDGITHRKVSAVWSSRTKSKLHWSGNFRGWIQYRQLIKGNTCWGE